MRWLTAALPFLPALRWRLRHEYRAAAEQARAIGWLAAGQLAATRWTKLGRIGRLKMAGFRHPLYFRPRTSDPLVIHQVFVTREYACATTETDVRYILDLGANIGCVTFLLLHRYPQARAVVVEPDAGNMALCRRNLAPFRDRVRFLQAGVWSEAAPMVVERGVFRDGAEWSFQVRPAREGEKPDFTAKTVGDLIAGSGFPHVDLLKMDIEGAETEVFQGKADWISSVRTLVIELHGAECEAATNAALPGHRFKAEQSGDLTTYRALASA